MRRRDNLGATMSTGGPPDARKPAAAGSINPYSPPTVALDGAGGGIAREGGGFKSATPLANAITVVMAIEIVARLIDGGNARLTISVMNSVIAGETVDRARLVGIDQRTGALALLSLGTLFVAGVLFCFFMPRANRNASAFGSLMSNSPGWAAGWFFVPVAGLWKPYYAMKEIWQGSDPDPTVHAMTVRAPARLALWWWMFLIYSFSGWIVAQSTKAVHSPSDLITASWVRIVTSALTIVAAGLAILVVRGGARRQDERQRRHPAGAPLPAPVVRAGVAP